VSAQVKDNPEKERYEIVTDEGVAGFVEYHQRPGLIAFVHTEIDPRFEGQGLGSQLARGALDDARARQMSVLPFCPFINGYIAQHPDYVDLVPAEHRERFGL
jgi:uncharacterized protein